MLFAFACRRLDRMVVPSQGVKGDLVDHFFAPAKRVRTIYNGVDLARVRARAAQGLPSTAPAKLRPWIVTAGRLSPEKGFDVLLQAFAHVRRTRDVDLVIVGEGPERERLERLAMELGVAGNVILAGFAQNPFPWLVQADVFAMTSRLEGFGNSLVEAMALGVPVVSTACPWGPREILAADNSGILVQVDDHIGLADALTRVLTNRELSAQLSRGGADRAENFGFGVMLRAYEDLLCELCSVG